MLLELLIAFDNPLLVRLVQHDFLLKHEQEVGLPRAFEALGDHLPAGVNARMAEGCERVRIPLAGEDRADDPHAGPPAEIADDVRELDVHLGQCLLHSLDAGADGAHVVAPLTPIRPDDTNLGDGMEGVTQEAVGMQL